jgi:hypothetical protein
MYNSIKFYLKNIYAIIIMTDETGASASEAGAGASEIYPRRLVFLQLGCMFCADPQGPTYITHVSLEERMGYMACGECTEKMQEAVKFWRTHRAYGAANHLKERTDLKIRRSNGDIEAGWCLNNPLVRYEDNGLVTIRCFNPEKNIVKWSQMETILELNSE